MSATVSAPGTDLDLFLQREEQKELLRFSTAGSVDDGKSTLIGRLLYDSKGVYEDQLASVRKASVNRNAGPIDFSLLTDGLRAEREQGITIDVAYRYFATPQRKFIIADTPGHEQYTRNMATGASTADLAIVLVDARKGVLPQSRRHAYIAALLGIPHIVVAVNKMDLVGYSEAVFTQIVSDFRAFVAPLSIKHLYFLPISALEGDNVVQVSGQTPWYQGPSLLNLLETVPVRTVDEMEQFRFPVQYVIRPTLDFRGFAGQIASGSIKPGDPVMVLPSGRTSHVKTVTTYEGDLPEAASPLSVTLTLADEVDISRGDMLVKPQQIPHVARRLAATLVWMHADPLDDRQYLVKHTSRQVRATVAEIAHRINVETLAKDPASTLHLNEIGEVTLETHQPLFFDAYTRNRRTGAFILIDPLTNATVAAGMILDRTGQQRQTHRSERESQPATVRVTPAERVSRNGHGPALVWLGSEAELAYDLERALFDRGCLVGVAEDIAAAHALAALGAIALVTGGEDPTEDMWQPDLLTVDGVLRMLEQREVIRPAEGFDSGEGI